MTVTEKFMFFVPNRYYTTGLITHLSFNIAVIPVDMLVTSMTLCIPVPHLAIPQAQLTINGIAGGWDEQLILTAHPPQHPSAAFVYVNQGAPEAQMDLTHLSSEWRFNSLQNHGLCIQSNTLAFSLDNPPYLLVTTN